MSQDNEHEFKVEIEAPWGDADITKPSDFLKHVIAQLRYLGAEEQSDDTGRGDDLEGYLDLQKTNDEEVIETFFKLKQLKRRLVGFGGVRNKDIIEEMKQKGLWV